MKTFNSLEYVNKPAPESIDTLVFSGAGAAGVPYAGVVLELEQKGVMANVNHFVGSSAGAIIAMVCALEYTPEQISEIVQHTDFKAFLDMYLCDLPKLLKCKTADDVKNFFASNPLAAVEIIGNLISQNALCPGEFATKWLRKLISDTQMFSPDITFANLHKLTGKKLTVTVCDLASQRERYLNHETAPTTKVADAVRASMAIPFVFKAVDVFGKGALDCVDGGTVSNLAVETAGKNFLAITASTKESILDPVYDPVGNLFDEAGKLIVTLRATMYNMIFDKQENIDRTIFTGSLGVGALDFDEAEQKKKELVELGRAKVREYFA